MKLGVLVAIIVALYLCTASLASAATVETVPAGPTQTGTTSYLYRYGTAYGLHAHWAWLQGKSNGSNIAARGGVSRCGTVVSSSSTPSVPACNGNNSIVIAVIDSGVDTSLTTAFPHVMPGADCTQYGSFSPIDPYPQITECSTAPGAGTVDRNGHGTRVSSSALASGASEGQYGFGVYGVAPGATLMPIDVGIIDNKHTAASIDWAVSHGADVINLSIGNDDGSVWSYVQTSLANAKASGVIVTCAAGNGGNFNGMVSYPANDPNCISVGNLQMTAPYDTWEISAVSSWGNKVDFAAPGTAVYEVNRGQATVSQTGGTSYASPAIAGTAAVLLANGDSSCGVIARATSGCVNGIYARMQNSARTVGDAAHTGHGLPDLGAAFGLAMPTHDVPDAPPPPPGGGSGSGTVTPTACTAVSVSVVVGASVSLDSQICMGAFTVEQAPSFGSLGVLARSYTAPVDRIGTTYALIQAQDHTKTQRIDITVTKQIISLARPSITCKPVVLGKAKCAINTAVPMLAGGGSATVVIQRRVIVSGKVTWKLAATCTEVSGATTTCVRKLVLGRYRLRTMVAATGLREAAASTFAIKTV